MHSGGQRIYQGIIDSFGEEGMQLPISIIQMHLKIVTQSWQPATALAVKLKNEWDFTVVKQSNCNQGLGGGSLC